MTDHSSHDHSHEEHALHGEHSRFSPQTYIWLVGSSGVLTGMGLMVGRLWPGWPADMIFFLAALSGGVLVFPQALSAVRHLKLDMNVLMTVAVAGAWLIGEHAEAASVIFLFALSELLETLSANRARRAIQSLLELTPEEANVLQPDGSTLSTPVAEVKVDDIVLVRSGERVPLDGMVNSGASAINQAPITGESMPVDKKKGDMVFAGTINGSGSLQVRVSKLSGESTLAGITRLVEQAQEQKAPTQRFVDRFAEIYTPAVFVLALLVALVPLLSAGGEWMAWAYRALALLVIACPCALVIATPVSIVSGLTALARRGVLIKGGAYLEAVGRLRALAVDKTGTITQGKPRVTSVLPLTNLSEEEVLARSAAIDCHSTHPLAVAVVAEAKERGVTFEAALNYESLSGRGAQGMIGGHPHFIGNHKLAHGLGVCSPELEDRLATIEARGESLAVVGHMPHEGCEGEALGILSIGDTIRNEAPDAVKLLHASGIEKIIMLSGDNQRTASAIAAKTGIDEALGDLMPEDKVEKVRALIQQYQHVGMVGDGVNDAPALAMASVGIAMGAAGSDTAIETADIALMNDDLSRLAEAISLGKRTLRVIQFNVGFALVVKAVFLVLALFGHTSLWLAILADTGATLLVIANALRLLRPTRTARVRK